MAFNFSCMLFRSFYFYRNARLVPSHELIHFLLMKTGSKSALLLLQKNPVELNSAWQHFRKTFKENLSQAGELYNTTWQLKEQCSPSSTASLSRLLECYFIPISKTLPLDLKQKLLLTQSCYRLSLWSWPPSSLSSSYHLLRVVPQHPSAPPTHSLECSGTFCWILKKSFSL